MHTPQKLAYAKPELMEIGSFEEVTLGVSTGTVTDAAFPSNTPIGDFTFLS